MPPLRPERKHVISGGSVRRARTLTSALRRVPFSDVESRLRYWYCDFRVVHRTRCAPPALGPIGSNPKVLLGFSKLLTHDAGTANVRGARRK
jgi:hypothetical protein